MKNHITFIAILLTFCMSYGQSKEIETQSVSIEHFITFIVDHIENKQNNEGAPSDQITFLLQTPVSGLIMEDKVVLKQAFKLISQRLTENDNISIITYSGFSGIALNKANPKELKQMLLQSKI